MTNEQINLLLKGVDSWNNFRENWGVVPCLDGTNIWGAFREAGKLDVNRRIPLAGVNFGWENFQEKPNLSGAYLRCANLRCASLNGANLKEAYFNHANLSGADLSGADMTGAKLEHADITGADLRDSVLTGVNFNSAEPWKARLYASNESEEGAKQAEISLSKVSSIEDFLRQIRNLKQCYPDLSLYFRGEPKCGWEMRPSVKRDTFSAVESAMLRDLMTHRPEEFSGISLALEQWILAQHHGLKTRFLDITKNPMVALFFACDGNNYEQEDGSLHTFAVPRSLIKDFTSDAISVIANFAKRPQNEQNLLLGHKCMSNPVARYHEAMDKLCQFVQMEKPYFVNRIDIRDFYRVFVVEPRQSHERIRAQSGAFLVSAFHERLERDEILKKNDNIPVYAHHQMVVPHGCKTAIMEDLRLLNITKEVLFPGLDTSAQAITELYSKGGS